ncbi:unnamed protein product [Callosobruchus maculatus]|uniref:Uncharacterized protein n=1 Tax=Callosobruchus maculatus TaxID=64391 RepID=A0A653CIH5_CALMS|nr:unnamed protein product [Callosobruchus maculatus]
MQYGPWTIRFVVLVLDFRSKRSVSCRKTIREITSCSDAVFVLDFRSRRGVQWRRQGVVVLLVLEEDVIVFNIVKIFAPKQGKLARDSLNVEREQPAPVCRLHPTEGATACFGRFLFIPLH